MKAKYALGIDGGGTKTVARLVCLETQRQWQRDGGPSSLTNDLDSACDVIKQLIDDLMSLAQVFPSDLSVALGLAGAGSESRVARLRQHLNYPFVALTVVTDATTSLYGANLGKPVAIVALGTGSVAARLTEDHQQVIQGGWGFIAGDEGSGAKLGLAAVQALIASIDDPNGSASMSPLLEKIASTLGSDRPTLLAWVAEATASQYAKLAPWVFELAPRCEVAQLLVDQHCQQVVEMIERIQNGSDVKVALLGGLAAPTMKWLPDNLSASIITPAGTALDGAVTLAIEAAKQNKQVKQ